MFSFTSSIRHIMAKNMAYVIQRTAYGIQNSDKMFLPPFGDSVAFSVQLGDVMTKGKIEKIEKNY
jgi:hypothetical protein